MKSLQTILQATLIMLVMVSVVAAQAGSIPDSIAATGETLVVTVHAQGAQVYECKEASGKLTWSFREPVATLIVNGKTVGRHYAGPHWEWSDGSTIAGKVSGHAPGATASDIPLLKMNVSERPGTGMFDGVTTIQRINTKGGSAEGTCPVAGTLVSVPYAADYAFYRKARAAQHQ